MFASETWLGSDFDSKLTFDTTNYTVAAMANRAKGAHGVVAILQGDHVISNVKNFSFDNFICAVEVKTTTCPILVVYFVPPKTSSFCSQWKQISESVGMLVQQFNCRTISTGAHC